MDMPICNLLEWCTTFSFNNMGIVELACMLQHLMTMFELSNN